MAVRVLSKSVNRNLQEDNKRERLGDWKLERKSHQNGGNGKRVEGWGEEKNQIAVGNGGGVDEGVGGGEGEGGEGGGAEGGAGRLVGNMLEVIKEKVRD